MSKIFSLSIALLIGGTLVPGYAAQADLDTLYRECTPQLGLSDSGCRCISSAAAKELSDKQQALIAAMVTKNQTKVAALQGQLNMDETMKAADFMTSAPQKCAGK